MTAFRYSLRVLQIAFHPYCRMLNKNKMLLAVNERNVASLAIFEKSRAKI